MDELFYDGRVWVSKEYPYVDTKIFGSTEYVGYFQDFHLDEENEVTAFWEYDFPIEDLKNDPPIDWLRPTKIFA